MLFIDKLFDVLDETLKGFHSLYLLLWFLKTREYAKGEISDYL